jgi:hypothetical protein
MTFAGSPSLWANDSGSKLVEKICQVDHYIHSSLKSKAVLPEELLVIFDVDGTLTNLGHPDSRNSAVKARGNSVEMVEELLAEHVKITVSSAWHDFSGTLHRLQEIGISRNPLLVKAHENSYPDTVSSRYAEIAITQDAGSNHVSSKIDVDYVRLGKIVSVRDHEGPDHKYYYQKALAPYVVWSVEELAKIRRVILVEDSRRNVTIFDEDVRKYHLYPNAKVEYFVLGPPESDPKMGDDIRDKSHACNSSGGDSIKPYQPEIEEEEKVTLKLPPGRKIRNPATKSIKR